MPKRPVRADAQRNLARIVEVAREHFGTQGTSVGMDAIAAAAGVGVGTLYRHFPTKDALIAEIVREQIDRAAEDASERAERDDPGEAFFGFLERLWSTGPQKKALVDALGGATDLRAHAASASKNLRRSLAKLLARAQAEGTVRSDVEVADVLALLGASLSATQRGGARDRLFLVLCDGLRPPRRTKSR